MSFSTTKTPYEIHPYAQTQALNESAARLVEIGQYDSAISALTSALELWKRCRSEDEAVDACICPQCIHFNEESSYMIVDEKEIDSRTTTPTSDVSSWTMRQEDTIENERQEQPPIGFEYGYLYQKMMRIPCRQKFDVRNVGSAVALIVIFNLAIVHHMSALTSNSKFRMAKTLRLYQLANDCLNTFMNDTEISFRKLGAFEIGTLIQMVLINNLGHLHSFMGNHLTSLHCIERLIPILMCVVDDKIRNIESQVLNNDIGCICLEGFFRNISPLVLTSVCADAA